MPRIAAVLTGDLIGSTKADPAAVELAMNTLRKSADTLAGWRGETAPRFTRFRGDGWQIVVEPPELALRAALFLKARLGAGGTGLATRIAIGIGPIADPGTGDLAGAHGPAFEASGRALDAMKRGEDWVIAGEGIGGLHRSLVTLLAATARTWSREQAEAMAHALDPASPTLAEISGRIGITPQAVSYRLKAAGYKEVDETLNAWENEAHPPPRGAT